MCYTNYVPAQMRLWLVSDGRPFASRVLGKIHQNRPSGLPASLREMLRGASMTLRTMIELHPASQRWAGPGHIRAIFAIATSRGEAVAARPE